MKFILSLAVTLFAFTASADIVKDLPKSDSLAGVANRVGELLRDNNISTGTTLIWAGELKNKRRSLTEDSLEELATEGFAAEFKTQTKENLPTGSKLQVRIGRFVDGDGARGTVHKMTAALMESNDYNTDNKELWDAQARYLWAILRQLPVSEKTWVAHLKTRVMDSSAEELRTVQYFLLLNADGRAVQFFTIQGTM